MSNDESVYIKFAISLFEKETPKRSRGRFFQGKDGRIRDIDFGKRSDKGIRSVISEEPLLSEPLEMESHPLNKEK
nr:hypothetical protein [Marseillevirus cajuinensis]